MLKLNIYVKNTYSVKGYDKIKQGSVISNVHIIAGNKVHRQIDDIKRLAKYYQTNNQKLWQKVIGIGVLESGDKVELHWYQHPQIGKVEFKVKRRLS